MLELKRCWTLVEAVGNRKGIVGKGRKLVRNFLFFIFNQKKKKDPTGLQPVGTSPRDSLLRPRTAGACSFKRPYKEPGPPSRPGLVFFIIFYNFIILYFYLFIYLSSILILVLALLLVLVFFSFSLVFSFLFFPLKLFFPF